MELDTIPQEHRKRAAQCIQTNLSGELSLVRIRLIEKIEKEGYWEYIYVVMWQRDNRPDDMRYGTHRFMMNSLDENAIIWGHYDLSFAKATGDFEVRS